MPGHERRGQALVPPEPDHVIDAVRAGRPPPCRRVDPSSMTSVSIVSMPGDRRAAESASVAGSVAASLRQGIWMISFMRGRVYARTSRFDDARPGDVRARSYPASPSAAARARSRVEPARWPRRALPDPAPCTRPFTPSTTNSCGPPASVVVTTGFPDEERLERDVPVVLIVRGKDYPEGAGIEVDDFVVAHLAEEPDAARQARATRPALRARRPPCRCRRS